MAVARHARLSLLLAAGLWSATAMTASQTGTVEVDLLFPRNDTFAPMSMMPIVFAIQNPSIVSELYPTLRYAIWDRDVSNASIDFQTVDLQDLKANDSTYYISTGIFDKVNTQRRWGFTWGLMTSNCSETDDPKWQDKPYNEFDLVEDGFHLEEYSPIQNLYFTTKDGGSNPDLMASDGCDKAQSFIYNIRNILDVPSYLSNKAGKASCPSIGAPAPTAQPCKASLSPDKAANISASLTQSKCEETAPASSCLPPDEDSAATYTASRRNSWMACAIATILFLHN